MAVVERGRERRLLGARGRKRRARRGRPLSLSLLTPATQATPSATLLCNIVATLFRIVTTLFQHCNAICLHASKFVLLSVFTLIGTICPNTCSKSHGSRAEKVHFRLTCVAKKRGCLKGLCHPTRMREPMKTNLKKSARLFQVLSEILAGCFYLSKSQPSFDS